MMRNVLVKNLPFHNGSSFPIADATPETSFIDEVLFAFDGIDTYAWIKVIAKYSIDSHSYILCRVVELSLDGE